MRKMVWLGARGEYSSVNARNLEIFSLRNCTLGKHVDQILVSGLTVEGPRGLFVLNSLSFSRICTACGGVLAPHG